VDSGGDAESLQKALITAYGKDWWTGSNAQPLYKERRRFSVSSLMWVSRGFIGSHPKHCATGKRKWLRLFGEFRPTNCMTGRIFERSLAGKVEANQNN